MSMLSPPPPPAPCPAKSKKDRKISAIAAALLRRNDNNTFKIHFCTPFCPFHHQQRPPLPMPSFYIVVDTASEDEDSEDQAARAELSCRIPSSACATPITSPEEGVDPQSTSAKRAEPTSYLDVAPTASVRPLPLYQLPEKFPNSPFEVDGDPIGAVPDEHKNSVRLFVVAVAQARKRLAERPDLDEHFTYDESDDEEQEQSHTIDLKVRTGPDAQNNIISPPLRRTIKFVLEPPTPERQAPVVIYDRLPLQGEVKHNFCPSPTEQGENRPDLRPPSARRPPKSRWRPHRPPTPVPVLVEAPPEGLMSCWLESQQLWSLGYWTETIFNYVAKLYPELNLTWAVDMEGRQDFFHSSDASSAFGLIIARAGLGPVV